MMKDQIKLYKAVSLWNRATAPNKLRTEHGHKAAQKAARKAKSFLFKNFREGRDFREFSDGSFWVIS